MGVSHLSLASVLLLFFFIFVISHDILETRVNNCLEDMKFIECINVKGKWIEYPPETIESNTRGIWTIQAPGDFDATHGNCTYQYANSNGTWVAFFYWHWSPYGGSGFGAGTNDVQDDESTVEGSHQGVLDPSDLDQCYWLWYGGDPTFNSCQEKVDETVCSPVF